jgi:hypothetical protein
MDVETVDRFAVERFALGGHLLAALFVFDQF